MRAGRGEGEGVRLLPERPRELLHKVEVLCVDSPPQDVVKVVLQLDPQGLGDLVCPAERVQLPLLLLGALGLHQQSASMNEQSGVQSANSSMKCMHKQLQPRESPAVAPLQT